MRVFAAVLLLLCVYTGAKAEEREPFGTSFYQHSDQWAFTLQVRFTGRDAKIIDELAEQVRQKPEEHWITWTNQLVNLSVKLVREANEGPCARLAVAKFEVLRRLGFAKEQLRLVYGRNLTDEHAVAAVYLKDGWHILDNRTVVADHSTPLDTEIKSFRAKHSFN